MEPRVPAPSAHSSRDSVMACYCALRSPMTAAVSSPEVPAFEVHSIEHWCAELVLATAVGAKLDPSSAPDARRTESWTPGAAPVRLERPGRPHEWRVTSRSPSAPRPEGLRDPGARSRLLHTFVHHELQAAELFAWAVLAFADAPREFRAGLVRLCEEELAHLRLYRGLLRRAGRDFGCEPVRDWFWQRVPSCATPESFVALQGLGLEGANLEHSARYAAAFRAAGDEEAAQVLEQVERDEIGHVAFAAHWFERFTGAPLDYDMWRSALPSPLTPAVLQGRPLNRAARRSAGLD
ncbi:MAG: ferritin-like domain-containing protein, partial [Planctomycetes bacterium]|nr:ferritin-like domain-containing protein [Planctomycetota bacterium]